MQFIPSRSPAAEPETAYDVVVYGGTPAGIAAAIAARKEGCKVVLLEPSRRIGGMTASGLGATDVSSVLAKRAVGGLARDFYRRIRAYYQKPEHWTRESYDKYRDYKYWGFVQAIDPDAMWTFEPKVALAIFEEMLREEAVPVVYGARLNRASGVTRDGSRIVEIAMEDGRRFAGREFIDATYEGDLLAAAGTSCIVGREANATYGESLNGVHFFDKPQPFIDPYKKEGDPTSGLLPMISPNPPGVAGEADHRVMAYCYRLCLTDDPQNRLDFPKPVSYDPGLYELLLRYIAAGRTNVFGNNIWMPNRKTDMNNGDPWFALNLIGGSEEYPEASYDKREEIIERHRDYQQGFLWFLANDPRVPESIQREVRQFGLPKDEFAESDHWPPMLYVREARRMVGDYVMTEQNCRFLRVAEDPVAMAGNHMDSHQTSRFVTPDGSVAIEGSFLEGIYAFGISYRSLVPKRGECTNLLVPVCLSASHVAYGSIRMEPVFMVLGQAVGTAAALAMKDGIDVQDVPYSKLRKALESEGQVLPSLAEARMNVVDDDQAAYSGGWRRMSDGTFVGLGYRVTTPSDEPSRASFPLKVAADGNYEVRLLYRGGREMTPRGRVVISDGANETEKVVNFSKSPADGFSISLGTYALQKEHPGTVVIESDGSSGSLSVDAVAILPASDL